MVSPDDDLLVVVSWGQNYAQCFTSILQLERLGINHKYDPCTQEAPVVKSQFSASFHLPVLLPKLPVRWGYALLPPSGGTETYLHMVPDWYLGTIDDAELHSCLFNLKTKMCKRVRHPLAYKDRGQVVGVGGHTYFFPQPRYYSKSSDPFFERYDPLKNEWEKLEPIPQYVLNSFSRISATVVWQDTILLNLFWAYNVVSRKWYQVEVDEPWSCGIEGEAIVIGNIIYALSQQDFCSVAVLSIVKDMNNGDTAYKCSLSKIIKIPGKKDIEFEYAEESRMSRHLVHLGGNNFCLVHSCKFESNYGLEYQHIQLTHLKLEGENSMTVTNKCVYQFNLESISFLQFEVRHCFSLPKFKTTDLKEGKSSFEFDPFPESFLSSRAPKYEDETDIDLEREAVHEEERSNTDEEGHSICVVKLSSDATVRQLVEILKYFGPILRVGIHVNLNTTSKPCAYVEFESAASKRLAIEASPIMIGGRRAVIQDMRRKVGVFVACEGDLSEVAKAAAAVAPQPISAQAFGNAFVQQYYQILHDSPELVYLFYQDISTLIRPEDDGSLSVTTTVNAINEKILSLSYGDLRAEIKSVDAQDSFSGAVLVLVTGYLTGIDNRIRNFSQCFLLAPQDQGFFVLNDIFHYVDSSSQSLGERVLVNDVVVEDPVSHEQSPVPPTVQESHVFYEDNHVDEVTKGQVLDPPEVTEVVDEFQDDSPPVVECDSKVEEMQKESYADIVKRSPFSSPAPVPRKSQESEGTTFSIMFLFSSLLIAIFCGVFWCSCLKNPH